jgi:hypothetical protein
MKAGFALLLIGMWIGALQGQSDLNTALGKGDLGVIAGHLADKLELAVGDTDMIVPKSDAITRLKEFYAAHQAKGFRSVHAGTSKTNASNYSIGELITDQGVYRVYIYLTQEGQKRLVTELRIEKQ